MSIRRSFCRGFTLIELLIVTALLAICGGATVTVTVRMMREHASMQRKMTRLGEARLAMEAVARDLARASSVTIPSAESSGGEKRTVLSMDLGREPQDDGARAATLPPKRVDYVLAVGRLERRIVAQGPKPPQVLCRGGGSLAVERRADLLHVEVACPSDPKYRESETRLATDFYLGGRLR